MPANTTSLLGTSCTKPCLEVELHAGEPVRARLWLTYGELEIPADDPRTANVFDPSIRGKTSQFMLRFRKPA